MLDTLHETENGAALEANQVGVLKRLVVIDFNDTRLKLVNPQMISQSGVQEKAKIISTVFMIMQ